jgi:hypothetical protein
LLGDCAISDLSATRHYRGAAHAGQAAGGSGRTKSGLRVPGGFDGFGGGSRGSWPADHVKAATTLAGRFVEEFGGKRNPYSALPSVPAATGRIRKTDELARSASSEPRRSIIWRRKYRQGASGWKRARIPKSRSGSLSIFRVSVNGRHIKAMWRCAGRMRSLRTQHCDSLAEAARRRNYHRHSGLGHATPHLWRNPIWKKKIRNEERMKGGCS